MESFWTKAFVLSDEQIQRLVDHQTPSEIHEELDKPSSLDMSIDFINHTDFSYAEKDLSFPEMQPEPELEDSYFDNMQLQSQYLPDISSFEDSRMLNLSENEDSFF